MGLFTQGIEISCSPAGVPERLHWQGQDYAVSAEPVRWFERRSWWAEEQRAQRGSGRGLVDHEIWRVQARGVEDGQHRTFDLSRHQRSKRWRMIRVHEALREAA
ncbi:DUF6504 family protein [Zhihengliuella salsuginis]|uniref:DUF6504 domain-containing protein n=1 Tax=Zhihengliuella salsuginis TaxID=578222 RepID=A0ABQ3GD93_9MICC|nr:DUF6504 family protein [Zhihengliuella salsuginis]GHD01977.1 hypothetical protein GCM10008096_06690 [Zhihengliuella salsuginis]